MISGPDGTGKSTIIKELHNRLGVETVWLRFHHYFSKIVNMIGRISGKSYKEKYDWGMVGYHDYRGVLGIFYIFSVYVDHLLFQLLIKNRKLKKGRTYLVDRYILDIIADLIVDTKNCKMVFFFFDRLTRKELLNFETYILECSADIVIARRGDLKDDKKYLDKINAYQIIARKYSVNTVNTGQLSVNAIVQKILNK